MANEQTKNDEKGGKDNQAPDRKDEPAFEQGAKIKPQNKVGDKNPNPGHPV